MIPDLLCKMFGPSWKTSTCAAMFLVSGFVCAYPDMFARWPALISIAKYIAVGSVATGLRVAKDQPK